MEREIAYSRDRVGIVGLCPCCGTWSATVIGCDPCFDKYRHEIAGGVYPIDWRDRLYEIGVRLRAEGKMPALRKEEETFGVWSSKCQQWARVNHDPKPFRGSRELAETHVKRLAVTLGMAGCYEVRPYPKTPGAPNGTVGCACGTSASGMTHTHSACYSDALAASEAPVLRPIAPTPSPRSSIALSDLPRALFDVEMAARAETVLARDLRKGESVRDGVARILDVMWAKTETEARKRATETATAVADWAKTRTKP